jgi:hypothetical protein
VSDPTTTEYAFDIDTQVEATAEGTFAATVTDQWNALAGGPNGGYLLAIGLQALRAVMAPLCCGCCQGRGLDDRIVRRRWSASTSFVRWGAPR